MRRVLVVSPRFPPSDGADMHRVRLSLPHFAKYGWEPTVLSVKPEAIGGCDEPLLVETLPPGVDAVRVGALPLAWTRRFGLGDVALRSFASLYRAGARLLSSSRFDLIYFSTTAFFSLPLGRLWKQRCGVPFVLDMQDPWLSDYYQNKPASARPPKYRLAHRLHSVLEPWTMKAVDGLVSVSADYLVTLTGRYPWLANKPQITLPFGASAVDFDLIRTHPQKNRFFRPRPGRLNGVYVGRGGKDMQLALRIIFQALKQGLNTRPDLFDRVRLHFIGTDYAPAGRGRQTVAPVASELGVGDFVQESPERVPYFEALQLLEDADFVIVPGSDDPQYTASKIYPYILARKPLLAVFHQRSSVCNVLTETNAGALVRFDPTAAQASSATALFALWSDLLAALPFVPAVKWDAFAPYTALATTRAQCELFDEVVGASHSAAAASRPARFVTPEPDSRCSH